MRNPIPAFGIVTLLPVVLLSFAVAFGGVWPWLVVLYITAFAFALDEALSPVFEGDTSPCLRQMATRLTILLAGCHFALLLLAVWALSAADHLSVPDRIGLFFAFGLFFGQISNSTAHELIHKTDKILFLLGKYMFVSLLFGHHTSAHRLVHHSAVGTPDDPNTAALGESFYRFAPRAWIGSFRAGLAHENARQRQRNGRLDLPRHPYLAYIGGAAVTAIAAGLIGGWGGVVALLGLAGYAQMQLLLSDYVQHYGLQRHRLPGGKIEPVAARHSWNAPHWFSAMLMLHAPRHSEHHMSPTRAFPALSAVDEERMPTLPRSIPIMAAIAFYPRRWRRLMDRRAERWNELGRREIAARSGSGE